VNQSIVNRGLIRNVQNLGTSEQHRKHQNFGTRESSYCELKFHKARFVKECSKLVD
jgi:hypothetical protein